MLAAAKTSATAAAAVVVQRIVVFSRFLSFATAKLAATASIKRTQIKVKQTRQTKSAPNYFRCNDVVRSCYLARTNRLADETNVKERRKRLLARAHARACWRSEVLSEHHAGLPGRWSCTGKPQYPFQNHTQEKCMKGLECTKHG